MSEGEYNSRSIDAVIAEMHANQRTILERLSELHEKHDERHGDVVKRLELLERWRWILVGVFAVGGIGGGVTADVLGKILKSLSTILLVTIAVAGSGCTTRKVSHPSGVVYTHTSFGVKQSFGELRIIYNTNWAEVVIRNFANDQVSAIREAKEFVQEVNKLKP